MRLVETRNLISVGNFEESDEWKLALQEIRLAVERIVWPPRNRQFAIRPEKHGNGVKPIKNGFLLSLEESGWRTERVGRTARNFDALKKLNDGRWIGLEWETGNVSSSHRSVNRILLAAKDAGLAAGVLVLPSGALYPFLTDRIGSFDELKCYFPLWQELTTLWQKWQGSGIFSMMAVEHDATDPSVPLIGKMTDGRALR